MEQLELTNYLSYKNRLYNYEFERATCSQVDGHVECVLPEKNNVKNFQTSNVSFIIVAYVVLFLCVCVVAIMVSVLVTKCANNRRIGKTQVIMWLCFCCKTLDEFFYVFITTRVSIHTIVCEIIYATQKKCEEQVEGVTLI